MIERPDTGSSKGSDANTTPPHDPANPGLEQELRKLGIKGDKQLPGVVALITQAYERGAADYITWGYGKRCKTKDLHDFPDLKEGERCPNCEEWEHYDEWLLEKGKPDGE